MPGIRQRCKIVSKYFISGVYTRVVLQGSKGVVAGRIE